ncbi:MAG TPA: hypothetical protein VFS10_03935 [Pyrinomonadaceae bacterium]|nr:hypothetical protein [Pyrinomonadaceae bacterium]
MSLRWERVFRRRKTELIITFTLLALAVCLMLLPFGPYGGSVPVQLGEKLAFAALVALAVRWIGIVFSEAELTDTDGTEYEEAIKGAHRRIWICQTWLPGIEKEATKILQGKPRDIDIKILLASFKERSFIYSRILGRKNITPAKAKGHVASSVAPFVSDDAKEDKRHCLKFNYGHHPGWIAVIDSKVFWGPTPVHVDNHTVEFLFHKHAEGDAHGAFWTTQFNLLWENFSHSYKDEKEFNEELP